MMLFAMLAIAAASMSSVQDGASRPGPSDIVAIAATATVTATPAQTVPNASTRYCFLNVQEDHITRPKVCMTRAAWMRRDVDPLDYIGRRK